MKKEVIRFVTSVLFVLALSLGTGVLAQAETLSVSSVSGGIISISGDEAQAAVPAAPKGRLKVRAAALPSAYKTEHLTEVQSQGSLNLCWSYGILDAGQIGLMKTLDLGEALAFSPGHLAYAAYHGTGDSWNVSSGKTWSSFGGNGLIGASTLLRWYGAADAASWPVTASLTVPEESLTASASHLVGFERLPGPNDAASDSARSAAISAIKQAVLGGGAVSIDFYYKAGASYDQSTATCYSPAGPAVNHQSLIVGWDDARETRAGERGAFLMKNTYGISFGESGYFWLSYSDGTMTRPYVWHFEETAPGEHLHQDLYSYDGAGYWVYMQRAGKQIQTANVFIAARDEQLDAVGFYAPAGSTYRAELRTGLAEGDPSTGVKAATVSGSVGYLGFYTISLPETVHVKKGEAFAVLLAVEQGGNGIAYFEGSSRTMSNALGRTTVTGSGETYVRVGEEAFSDVLEYTFVSDAGGRVSGKQYGNACVKVYGNPADGVGDAMGSRSAEVKPPSELLEESGGTDADLAVEEVDANLSDEEALLTPEPSAEEEGRVTPQAEATSVPTAKATATPTAKATATPTARPTVKVTPTPTPAVAKEVTVYNGVDYSPVYNFKYYMKAHPSLQSKYGKDPKGALKHFVRYGIPHMWRGSKEFNVKSYVYEYASLRRKYGTSWRKYYLHYIRVGRKKGWHGTGCTKMKNALTVYKGKNYKKVYDFNYYVGRYYSVRKKYRYDDYGALKYYVRYGRRKGQKAKKS